MSKKGKKSEPKDQKDKQDWPVVVYMWIVGLGLFGYVFGRVALEAFPHPVHWSAGLIGAALGLPLGWLWYRWRGDVL